MGLEYIAAGLGASTLVLIATTIKWKYRALQVRGALMTSVRVLEYLTDEAKGYGMYIEWRRDALYIDGKKITREVIQNARK